MNSIDYMVIDSSMMASWRTIILKYIRLAFDFAFPFFAIFSGIVLFVFVVTLIHRKAASRD